MNRQLIASGMLLVSVNVVIAAGYQFNQTPPPGGYSTAFNAASPSSTSNAPAQPASPYWSTAGTAAPLSEPQFIARYQINS